jgi:capsular exopolysaccharide synthesis family protein
MGSWSGSSLERLVRGVLRRRKRLFLISSLVAVVLLMPVAFVLSKEPPRYRATAVVLLEARPDRVPVFQDMVPNRPFPVQMAILSSRSLAETVVENLPKASLQELIETSYQTNLLSSLLSAYQGWRGIEPPAPNPMRRALAELQRARISFQPWPDRSGIITISAEASRPSVSVDIINTYIEALMSRTRSFNIDDARVSREFLEQQLTDVKRTMNLSEQSLQTFVGSHGGVRLPDQSKAAADRLGHTEAALTEAVSNRKMVETRLMALREKVEGQKRPADKSTPVAARPSSPDVDRLRNELAKLEASLLELRMKYTEEHPRIQLVKNRIDELTSSLGGVLKDSVVSTPLASAVPAAERVNFSEQLIGLEATYHSMLAREEALTKQADVLRQSLRGLSGGEAEYARLSREVDSQRNLHAMLSDKLTAARIREQGEMKVVKVIDPPGPAVPAGNEKRMLALAVAFAAALGLGAAVPTGVEWLHRRIENEDDVELATGLPILALIPAMRTGRPVFMNGIPDTTSRGPSDQLMFTEAFRALRVAIELSTRGEPLKRLLVTSAFAGEGKSTVVANLGYALNEAGHRVVLADTDFLRPTLHRAMRIKSSKGLVETLESETPLEPTLVPVNQGLWLAQRGESINPRSRGLLAGSKLRELISELTNRADFVICDSSPVLLIPDNLLLASAVDGVVLVAKAGVTGFRDLAKTKAMLEGAGARILGVVLNQVPVGPLRKYYSGYYDSYVKPERK